MKSDNLSQGCIRNWLNSIYHKAFPHLVELRPCFAKIPQMAGVDMWVLLKGEIPIMVEEKIRFYDFTDLLLEEYSIWEKDTIGWALDPNKKTDYLFYAIVPLNKVYVFVYPPLRDMFLNHYVEWLGKFGRVFGKTFREGAILYHTSNIPIPLDAFPTSWLAKYFWQYS